jgi:hypothetical protein
MNFWRTELTDSRSIRIRFFLFLLRSLPWLVIFWLLNRRISQVAILAVVYFSLGILEVVSDYPRLKHPDTPISDERIWRVPAIILMLVGIFFAVFLFT